MLEACRVAQCLILQLLLDDSFPQLLALFSFLFFFLLKLGNFSLKGIALLLK